MVSLNSPSVFDLRLGDVPLCSLQCGSWRHLLLKTFALPAVLARHFVI